MSKHERSAYFEQLVTLKLRPVGPEDRESVISIDDMVAYAEALMASNEEADALEAAEMARSLARLEPTDDETPVTGRVDYTELPATPDGRNPNRRRFDRSR